VHGELVDVGRCRDPGGGSRGSNAVRDEVVELRARLPEVKHAPAAVDRTGCVKDQPVRVIAGSVECRFEPVELLSPQPVELDADSYGRRSSLGLDQATAR
jgi:hypothetical protein